MYVTLQLSWNITIPPEQLHLHGVTLKKAIITRLLEEFAAKKATMDLGYFLAVTSVDRIGEGKVREHSGEVLFPVHFSCITFKIFRGEILQGVVKRILKHGVFLSCEPLEYVYLSHQKMPDYLYLPGENPIFISDTSKIEKGDLVRFVVIGVRFIEAQKEFQAVVGLEGDFLGPL